jgi:hypothetical protein
MEERVRGWRASRVGGVLDVNVPGAIGEVEGAIEEGREGSRVREGLVRAEPAHRLVLPTEVESVPPIFLPYQAQVRGSGQHEVYVWKGKGTEAS